MIRPEDEKERILAAIGAESPFGLTETDLARLSDFVAEYLHYGKRLHLVSRRDPGMSLATQIIESLHMLDFAGSLGHWREIGRGRIADIGTGFGFPGLVWSLLRDDLPMTLIERKEKCVSFLEMMISRLKMGGANVLKADAGRTVIEQRFDLVTTKAAGRLSEVIPIISGLVRGPGLYVTIKEADWKWEMEGLKTEGAELLSSRDLPGMTGVLLAFGVDARPGQP